jgi:hypothetical protein
MANNQMNSPTSLTGAHLRTYKAIFHHPAGHNIAWTDVHALFREMGSLDVEPNGNLKAAHNGKTLVLQPTHDKQVETTDEIVALRHFLAGPETPLVPAAKADYDWLLVIDHHEARIFRSEEKGAQAVVVNPQNPEHYFRHAHNSREFNRGQEKPEPNSFFEPVAAALEGAKRILIFGSGTGSSSEMEQFVSWLKEHHSEASKRIIGTVVIDSHHMTNGELLARARTFYENAKPSSS